MSTSQKAVLVPSRTASPSTRSPYNSFSRLPHDPRKTCARARRLLQVGGYALNSERTAGPRQVAQVPVQKSEPATPGRSGKRRSRQDEGRSGAEKVWCDVMGHGVKTM